MIVDCKPFLQQRYLLLRIEANPESRLIFVSDSGKVVVYRGGLERLVIEGHIQHNRVLISSLSILDIVLS